VLVVLLCLPATAAADRPYTAVFNENHQGDITGTGNTLMSCFEIDPKCADARNGVGGSLNNNDLSMDWVDVDGDPDTFNSSAATLVLPVDARVLRAVLIYTGRLNQGADVGGCQGPPSPTNPCLRSRPAPNPDQRDRVLFSPPGLNAYLPLTAAIVDDALDNSAQPPVPREYQGVVDVTNIVRSAGAGEYKVANVQLGTGKNDDQAGGWALAVAYEDSSQPMRNLTMFSGFRFVLSNGPPVDIPLSGFTTPKSGPVTTTLGLVAIEGDLGLTGDSATINAVGSGAAGVNCPAGPGAACRLTNATNPATNFFNASISDRNGQTFTQRRPNFLNQMGFDADVINATRDLQNNQTSTTIRLATSGDGFAPNGVSFATDLFAPSLRVSKTVSPAGPVQLGDELTYTVGVSNSGLDAAVNTILTDAIPAGTTYSPGSLRVLSGANAGPKTDGGGDDQAEFDTVAKAVVFRLGDTADAANGGKLPIGASTEIQFKVRVNSQGVPSGFNVVNSAGVGFLADTLGTPGQVNSPNVITPVLIPDLTIKKSHTGQFQAGRRTPFTLVVSNVGDADSRGPITVTDTLPDELTFTTQPSGDGWDCGATSGRTLSCVRSDALAPNQSFPPITFVARVAGSAQPGDLSNTAKVSATPDGNPTNNTDTDTGPLTRPLIDLAIAKTAVTRVAFPGETVQFTIQVTNLGPDTATRVRVRDVMPAGLTPISLTPSRGSCGGPEGTTCSLGRMQADATATIDVKALAGPDTGGRRLRNRAVVRGREDEVTLANNVDRASVRILPLVDLVVTKTPPTQTVPDGGTASWTVTVDNDGPSTATNIRFADILPAPLRLVSATPLQGTCTGLTCDLGTLDAGGATQVVIVASGGPGLAGQTFTNVAAAAASEAELSLANNVATAQVTFSAVAPPPANVVVTKTASPRVINVGGQVTYRITATNQGPGTAEHAIVTDTPDAGLQLISVTPSQGTCKQAKPIICDVGPLAPGASATVVVVARATEPGRLRNGVSVLPSTGGGGGGRPGAIDVADVVVVSPPVVTLRKRADRHVVAPGAEVTFTMTARARGVGTAHHVVVCDRLPQGLAVVHRGGAHLRRGLWCWTIAKLRAGHSRRLRLGVRVAATAAGKRRTNVAVLTFADQPPRVARARIRVLAAAPNFTG
jgi:uncharacterized repeat protein (TIGR01451 family)